MAITKCRNCLNKLDPEAVGPQETVRHTNGLYYHKECLELFLWRKESVIIKNSRNGKAGPAANGRIVRSPRGLS